MLLDELLRIAQKRAVQEDVLARGELHVEAGAELDQRRDAAVDGAGALGGLEHAGDDLEHGGLARAVRAQDAEHVALADGERHAVERAELLEHKLALCKGDGVFLQAVELLRCHVEDHGHAVHVDHDGPVVDCGGKLALDVAERGGVDVLGHRFRLNVEDELLLGRLEHGEADGEGDRGHAETDEVLGEAGHRVVHRDVAEIAHVVVHRVERLGRLHPVGQKAHRVEQRRGVGPCGDDDAPQVAHVAEEHGERGEQHAEPRAEEQHEHEQNGHREQVHRRRDAEEEHDDDDRDEGDREVHEREEHLLQREDHLRHAHLLDERRRFQDGAHGRRRRVGHEREKHVAQDEVHGEVLHVVAELEHVREHGGEHAHHEQGV